MFATFKSPQDSFDEFYCIHSIETFDALVDRVPCFSPGKCCIGRDRSVVS